MPPLPVKSSGVLFERGARKLGLHPVPAPLAIKSQFYNGRPGCVHCGFCHGFACEVMAKASTLTTVIPQAEATGNCEIRAQSYVSRVEHDKRGRVTGVHYFDADRHEHFQRARAVVLAANGAETPRLLLNSASPAFPQGLANGSGMVGKHLMFNYTSVARGLFEHELNEFKSVQVSRILHDFYDSDPKRGFYGGGGLDARMGPQPTIWAQRNAGEGPGWGAALKERLREFPRSMQVAGHGTSLPLESNNVTLDPVLKDAWGIPVPRSSRRSRQCALPAGSRRGNPRRRGRTARDQGPGHRKQLRPAPARHLPHGRRSSGFRGRSTSSQPRSAEPVHLRWQQLSHLGSRSTHHDHPGARVPCRRAHRRLRAQEPDLDRFRM
jgi:choline dehydrogenase-like flavoprotein